MDGRVKEKLSGRTVDSPITILISLSDHLINLIICQLLTNGCHDMTELSGRDEAVVITIENLSDQRLIILEYCRPSPP